MHTYHVYILTNVKRNVMYVGVTNNIDEAIVREKEIKGW
jgi:predicted GIY-YIG superfamily endonuclease